MEFLDCDFYCIYWMHFKEKYISKFGSVSHLCTIVEPV